MKNVKVDKVFVLVRNETPTPSCLNLFKNEAYFHVPIDEGASTSELQLGDLLDTQWVEGVLLVYQLHPAQEGSRGVGAWLGGCPPNTKNSNGVTIVSAFFLFRPLEIVKIYFIIVLYFTSIFKKVSKKGN